jgi:hypothetical protein
MLEQALLAVGVDDEEIRDQYHSHAIELECGCLHTLATIMLRPLMPEYSKLVGLDTTTMGEDALPLNRYTWQEIARQLLWACASKEVGVPEQDRVMNVKSRGSVANLDAADRRVLRLLRSRIAWQWLPRGPLPALGTANRGGSFRTGFLLRLPAPRSLKLPTTCKESIARVQDLPGTSSAIRKLIENASEVTDDVNIRSELTSAISPSAFHNESGRTSRQIALSVLNKYSERNVPENPQQAEIKPLTLVLNPDAVGLAPIKILQLEKSRLRTTTVNEPVIPDTHAPPIKVEANDMEVDEFFTDAHARQNPDEEDDEDDDEPQSGATTLKAEHVLKDPSWNAMQPFEPQVHLSEAMKRCTVVMRALTTNPHSKEFNVPVDPKALPNYYVTIRQPMTLSDIALGLQEGKYTSIRSFYDDCRLLFENCRCYNGEISPIMQVYLLS